MEKHRTMKETKELLNLLVIFAIVLLCFCSVTMACPLCPPCYAGDQETGCDWTCSSGESCCGTSCYDTSTLQCCDQETGHMCLKPVEDWECCDGHCCSSYDCESCDNGTCEYCDGDYSNWCCDGECYDLSTEECCDDIGGVNDGYKCPSGESCCDGDCYDSSTEKCCNPPGPDNGYKCPESPVDFECCHPSSDCCDPDECESCIDGECKVCGGDTSKVCCDGACCRCDCIGGECVGWILETGLIDLFDNCYCSGGNCGGEDNM